MFDIRPRLFFNDGTEKIVNRLGGKSLLYHFFYDTIFAKLFNRKVNVDKNGAGNELSARLEQSWLRPHSYMHQSPVPTVCLQIGYMIYPTIHFKEMTTMARLHWDHFTEIATRSREIILQKHYSTDRRSANKALSASVSSGSYFLSDFWVPSCFIYQ